MAQERILSARVDKLFASTCDDGFIGQNALGMLVPGFEPGSTDRESVMMDRTTLHERGLQPPPFDL